MANSESEVQYCHVYALAAGREDGPATRDSVLATARTHLAAAARGMRCKGGCESENSRPEAGEAAKNRGLQPRSARRAEQRSRVYLSWRGLSRAGRAAILEPDTGWLPRG